MSASFNKIVGITCITVILQLGVKAQNQITSQIQTPKLSQSSGNNSATSSSGNTKNTELNNQLALASDNASEKTLGKTTHQVSPEAISEKRINPATAEPKVALKNPSVQFNMTPVELKLNSRPFSDPSLELSEAAKSFQATAYSLSGRTRSGAYTRRGVIAADPRVIPLGSVVQIKTPGYSGVYTVHDTGKRIKGNIIDVWVGSGREARFFGRRQIKLHVLRLGPKANSDK
jgi:3D (Asp-Asp-Asp) domain-containing protein